MVTTRAQCNELSTARCERTVVRNGSGPSLSPRRKKRVSVLRFPLVSRVAVTFPTVCRPGQWCSSCSASTFVADGHLADLDAPVALVHVVETLRPSRVLRIRHVEPGIVAKRLLIALGAKTQSPPLP